MKLYLMITSTRVKVWSIHERVWSITPTRPTRERVCNIYVGVRRTNIIKA